MLSGVKLSPPPFSLVGSTTAKAYISRVGTPLRAVATSPLVARLLPCYAQRWAAVTTTRVCQVSACHVNYRACPTEPDAQRFILIHCSAAVPRKPPPRRESVSCTFNDRPIVAQVCCCHSASCAHARRSRCARDAARIAGGEYIKPLLRSGGSSTRFAGFPAELGKVLWRPFARRA